MLAFGRIILRRPFVRNIMSFSAEFKQAPHKLLVIPGPVEIADEVLYANAHPSVGHTSPEFIPVLGDCIRLTRKVLFTENAQPFIISGSGTLGWDQVSANLIEPGDHVLVLQTGYFGDSFADCLQTYGANVTQLTAPIGAAVSEYQLESALKERSYKMVTFTHVDTSTGVLNNAKALAAMARRVAPQSLIVMDAVCSVATEEIQMDGWGLDVVLTASQKGLGAPPGLSILVASQRALEVYQSRKTPVASYYASWKNWLPIMEAYEANRPAYFATPPVNLVYAYRTALELILTKPGLSLEQRFEQHQKTAEKIGQEMERLGLKFVAEKKEERANSMSALYLPEGVNVGELLPRLSKRGVVVTGGLHKDIKDKYFRIGHMGVTAVEDRGDVDQIITSLRETLVEITSSKQ